MGEAAPWHGVALLKRVLHDEVLQDVFLALHSELTGREWLLGWDDAWGAEQVTVEAVRGGVFVVQPRQGSTELLLATANTTDPIALRTLDDCHGEWNRVRNEVIFSDPTSAPLTVLEGGHITASVQLGNTTLAVALLPYSKSGSVRRESQSNHQGVSGNKYAVFISRMKDPAASPLVRSIKKFISSVAGDSEKGVEGAQSALPEKVASFLNVLYQELKRNELWGGASADDLQQGCEGMEKYVLCKIHQYTFGRDAALIAQDTRLQAVMDTYPECPPSFSIPDTVSASLRWREAVGHLKAITDYKAPYDKLICLSNCCRIALGAMTQAGVGGANPLAACLPMLLHEARVANVSSNVAYIQQYSKDNAPDDLAFLQGTELAIQRWLNYTPLGGKLCEALALAEVAVSAEDPPLIAEGVDYTRFPLSSVQPLLDQVAAMQKMEALLLQELGLPPRDVEQN